MIALPTIHDMMDGRANADFVACEGCNGGIVERRADDYDADTGSVGYAYLNGCSQQRGTVVIDGKTHTFTTVLCRDCTAHEPNGENHA